MDEIDGYEIFRDKIIRILKNSHGNLDEVITKLRTELEMDYWENDYTHVFLSPETEIILALDCCDGYHIYFKEARGQW